MPPTFRFREENPNSNKIDKIEDDKEHVKLPSNLLYA